jgi:hypothetical protein
MISGKIEKARTSRQAGSTNRRPAWRSSQSEKVVNGTVVLLDIETA